MGRRTALALIAGLIGMAAGPAAQAQAFGVGTLEATTSTSQAGAPADLTLRAAFDQPEQDLRRLVLSLPPGLLGNPRATVRCTQEAFAADACPAASRVGSTTVSVTATFIVFPIPLDAPGEIYNVEPAGSEPARLGIRVRPVGGLIGTLALQAPVTLRRDDLGLDATLDELPREFGGLPIDLTALTVTLDARAGEPRRPFLTLPTSCETATIRATATSYDGGAAPSTRTTTLTPTGCGAVPFTPGVELDPPSVTADAPTGLGVTLTVPGAEEPVRQAHVRAATVALPEGVVLSPGVTAGLTGCDDAQAASPEGCPASSAIGDLRFDTPLLGELAGTVSLAAQTPERPLGLRLRIDPAGLDVRLTGAVTADPQTGRVTARFAGLPPVPFTRFALRFRGGANAVLRAPATCGTATAQATLTPYSGGPDATPTATLTTTGCPEPAFAPQLRVDAAEDRLAVTLERPDRQPRLRSLRVVLPQGVAGRLGTVPPCAIDEARAGRCDPASRVGATEVLVGAGEAPVTLAGDVFLTTPPQPGALAGLAVVLPARVGPLDLGTQVVLASLELTDGVRVAVSVPELPQAVGGIPLDLRRLTLALDRPGFVTQASSCAEQAVSAEVVAASGEQASVSAPYTAPGCAARPLATTISATSANVAGGRPVPLTVVLEQPDGATNLKSTAVTLPAGIAIDPAALAVSCTEAQLTAGACPPASTIGQARVDTPLLGVPLTGPVRLVAGAAGLPTVAVDLGGPISLRLRGSVGFDQGRIRTVFGEVPDVPLARFSLRFTRGLTAGEGTCAVRGRAVVADLTGHNGLTGRRQARLDVTGCTTAPRVTATLRGRQLTVVARAGTSKVRRVQVVLPKGRSAVPKGARKARRTLTASRKRAAAAVTLRARLAGRTVPRRLTVRVAVRDARGTTVRRTLTIRRR